MILKYDLDISKETIQHNLRRMTNQIYKLLPNREEGGDWITPLSTIIVELIGMQRLFIEKETLFFAVVCKLEGLCLLNKEEDFYIFRKTIFECLNLISKLSEAVVE